MEELTPNYILNNYTDKINSVGYKIKQAIGHPYEQIRLVLQLKIYIKSMIKDLMKMSDKCFDDDSTTFDSMSSLYDTVYGILTTITTTGSGVMIDTTGSDTDVVMTKDNNKDAIISKFKMLLAGMDKTLRYLQSMNNQKINMTAYESLTFLEEINIADEASMSYRMMRKAQTNTVALNYQLHQQKKLCEKKFKESVDDDEKKEFIEWLKRSKAGIQRKINGKEIKNKNALQKFINLYDSYLNRLGSPANESFFDIINQ